MSDEVAIQQTGVEQPFIYRGFQMVNQEKLREIRGDVLRGWAQSGLLPLLYAHIFSLDLMSTMRASRSYVIRRVILPAIVPWILTAVRIGVGLALIGAVVAELIGSNQGLGWYIEKSGGRLDTTGVFTGLVVLMAVAMLANFLIVAAERRLLRWRGNTR